MGEGTCNTFGAFTIWTFIDVVNDVENAPLGFAGYNDWRVPTIRELESLRSDDLTKWDPAVEIGMHGSCCGTACTDLASPGCSCTENSGHWTATTYVTGPTFAWFVAFYFGETGIDLKRLADHVRAVRGGL